MADALPLRRDVLPDAEKLPLVVDARRLAALLSAGVRTVRTWDSAGRLPAPVRIGGRVVWRTEEIRAWLEAGAPDRSTWEALRAARK